MYNVFCHSHKFVLNANVYTLKVAVLKSILRGAQHSSAALVQLYRNHHKKIYKYSHATLKVSYKNICLPFIIYFLKVHTFLKIIQMCFFSLKLLSKTLSVRQLQLKNMLLQFFHEAYIRRSSKLYSAFNAPMWLITHPCPPPPLHLIVATSQSDCQEPATALLCSRKHLATVLNE